MTENQNEFLMSRIIYLENKNFLLLQQLNYCTEIVKWQSVLLTFIMNIITVFDSGIFYKNYIVLIQKLFDIPKNLIASFRANSLLFFQHLNVLVPSIFVPLQQPQPQTEDEQMDTEQTPQQTPQQTRLTYVDYMTLLERNINDFAINLDEIFKEETNVIARGVTIFNHRIENKFAALNLTQNSMKQDLKRVFIRYGFSVDVDEFVYYLNSSKIMYSLIQQVFKIVPFCVEKTILTSSNTTSLPTNESIMSSCIDFLEKFWTQQLNSCVEFLNFSSSNTFSKTIYLNSLAAHNASLAPFFQFLNLDQARQNVEIFDSTLPTSLKNTTEENWKRLVDSIRPANTTDVNQIELYNSVCNFKVKNLLNKNNTFLNLLMSTHAEENIVLKSILRELVLRYGKAFNIQNNTMDPLIAFLKKLNEKYRE